MATIKQLCAETNTEYTEALAERYRLLKAVYRLTMKFNDEEDYEYCCICGIPDEPTDYDFLDLASDEELTYDALEVFVRAIRCTEAPDRFVFTL